MRITKKWLRDAKQILTGRLNLIFAMSDQELMELVQRGFLGCTVSFQDRQEMLRLAMYWEIETTIPDSMVF